MFKKEMLFFALFLISCIFISMSFVSANTNITNDDSQSIKCDDSIIDNNPKNNFLENDDLNESEDISEFNVLEDNSSENSDSNWVFYPFPPNDPSGTITWYKITNNTNTSKVVINKSSVNVFAKNKVFNKKLKTKLYPVVLKSKNGKVLKNALITLKIKGKLFKAKTNGKGKATFKITKFNKKGNFKAVVKFDGNEKYNKFTKKVKIVIK